MHLIYARKNELDRMKGLRLSAFEVLDKFLHSMLKPEAAFRKLDAIMTRGTKTHFPQKCN